ncbi:MAG: hypothetical protein K2J48_03665 [Muribaculaceae bacterium]|nr:hypothetical protein [Muribaculaceae bacterium]
MKIIKIFIVVVVFGLLIYGIFSIAGSGSGSTKIDPNSPSLLDDLKRRVDNDWDNTSLWNQTVYEKNISDANVYHNDLEKIAAGNYSTLLNYTNEKACDKLIQFVNTEFASASCSPDNIAKFNQTIDYFVKANGSIPASDPRIVAVRGKIKLYNDILAFGKKQISLSPGFNMSSGSWNDFSSYRTNQINIRDAFKRNTYYSSISHIPTIKNSLNSLEGKLSSARNSFEKNLSASIISAFENAPRTSSNQKQLQYIYGKYYESYDDGKRLSDFRKRFIKEVEEESRPKKSNTQNSQPYDRW